MSHGGGNSRLDGGGFQPFLHNDIGNDLGIRGGVENGAAALQLLPQLLRVGEVAVVGQRHPALEMVHQNGLDVPLVVAAGGAVAHMAHSDAAGSQRLKPLLGEYLADQPHIPVGRKNAVVVHGDAGAFLPPVLKGIQRVVCKGCHIRGFPCKDAEHAAFLMDVALPDYAVRGGGTLSPHRDPAGAS